MSDSPGKYIGWLAFVSVATGFAEGFVPDTGEPWGAFMWPHMLVSACLLFGWCRAHARASNVEEPSHSALWCALIWPIGVPLYYFRAFGFKKGCIGTLKAVAVAFAIALAFTAANEGGRYIAGNASPSSTSQSGERTPGVMDEASTD